MNLNNAPKPETIKFVSAIFGLALVVAVIAIPTTDDNTPASVDRARLSCATYGGVFAMGTRIGFYGPFSDERKVWVLCKEHAHFEWTYTKVAP